MKATILALATCVALAGCASTRLPEAERLAIYKEHAGPPARQVRNIGSMGWDRIDDEHLLLELRPREAWLVRVSGPCLDWAGASPVLRLSSMGAFITPKLDRILIDGSPTSCRIEEMRPVDLKVVRQVEERARSARQASGT